MKARLYDPELGRFVTADPIIPNAFWSEPRNPFSYVLNNPVNHVDPEGYVADGGVSTIVAIGGAAFAAGGLIYGCVESGRCDARDFEKGWDTFWDGVGDAFSFFSDDTVLDHARRQPARSYDARSETSSAVGTEAGIDPGVICHQNGCVFEGGATPRSMHHLLESDAVIEAQTQAADLGEKLTAAAEAAEVVGDAVLTAADLAGADGSPIVPTVAAPITAKWSTRLASRGGFNALQKIFQIRRGTGNFGIGKLTASQADELGRAFVGNGGRS